MEPTECKYARAAVASARAGLEHIRKERPHSYLALFMVLGLIANTRHIWHALTLRDRADHQKVIDAWAKSPPEWTKRLQALLNPARDLLLKEWLSFPLVVTGNGRYEISMYIPAGPKQEAAMTDAELRDREDAIRIAQGMGEETARFSNLMRIDVLVECSRTLDLWESELTELERQISETT